MLIAPIFKVDYLSIIKETESQDSRISDIPPNIQKKNSRTTSSTYNIFKTAINRGTELIKNTFLPKSTSLYTDSIDFTNSVVQSKLTKIETDKINRDTNDYNSDEDSSSESSSSSSTSSSPDSIQTELTFFKPIVREPRTTSSNAAKILKLPSIRSTSSNSTILTPCPSPFSITVTAPRQSAFSFVTNYDEKTLFEQNKNRKRQNGKHPEKKSDGLFSSRKKGNDTRKNCNDIKDSILKTDEKLTTRSMIKKRQLKSREVEPATKKHKKSATLNSNKSNLNEFRRVTRSMKH